MACSVSESFAPDAAAMLSSLVRSNPPAEVHVHLLHDETLSSGSVRQLAQIVERAGGTCAPRPVDPARAAALPASDRFPRLTWYRMLLPELLPDLSRALYLDTDTLVVAPLQPLWQTDLGDRWLGAVTNPLFPSMRRRIEADLGLPGGALYFNSGVLLLDLDAWRANDVTERVLEVVASGVPIVWPDQDALNAVLHEHWLPLHPRWNAMPALFELPRRHAPHPATLVREAVADPAVVHFVGPHKPWHYRSRHPFRDSWFRHLEATPWAGRPVEGRSARNALLRPLPALWALRIELALAFAQRRRATAVARLRAAR